MTPEKIDYVAILADMKAKRSALDASIVALEMALASGTLGPVADGVVTSSASSTTSSPLGQPMDLPSGAFLGRSMPDAVKLYLIAMRQRKTVKDIATALRSGGVVSTSRNFEAVVQGSLQRLKMAGQLLKFADGWGLAEWSPASFRTSSNLVAKSGKKAKSKSKRKVAKAPKAVKPDSKAGLVKIEGPKKTNEATIEVHFGAHPGDAFSTSEVAKTLGIHIGAVNLVCAKLADRGKLEKTPEGKFRTAKVQAMPKAGSA